MALYSHSRLSTYEQCRLRYRLKYLDRVKRDSEGVEAFLGSRVHDALESLYRDILMGRTPGIDDVLAHYSRAWDEKWHDGILVVSGEYAEDDYRRVGEECLRRYHSRWAPFRSDQTLGVEIRVAIDLPGGGRLQGFVDRVARDPDGWISIHDYKTSQKLPAQADLDRDRQLALYQAGIDRQWPGAPGVRLVWHYLRFDEVMTSSRTREQITALLRETADLVEQVESETDWTPSVSMLCNWCPYWDLCPEKKHEWSLAHQGDPEPSLLPSPVPAAREAERALDDAVDASLRMRAAKADLADARHRLLEYARETGATRVANDRGAATMRPSSTTRLPRRNQPGHERLRAAVIAAGVLDRYADVATRRLLEDLAAGVLSEELATTVRSLAEQVPAGQVRVRPARGADVPVAAEDAEDDE